MRWTGDAAQWQPQGVALQDLTWRQTSIDTVAGRVAILEQTAEARQAHGTLHAAAMEPSAADAVVSASHQQMPPLIAQEGNDAEGGSGDADVHARSLARDQTGRSLALDSAPQRSSAPNAAPSSIGVSGLAADASDAAHSAECRLAAAGAGETLTGLGGAFATRAEATLGLSAAVTPDAEAATDAAVRSLPGQQRVAVACSSRDPRVTGSAGSRGASEQQALAHGRTAAVPDATNRSRPTPVAGEDQAADGQSAAEGAPVLEASVRARSPRPRVSAGPALNAQQSPSVGQAPSVPAVQPPPPPVLAGPSVAGAAASEPIKATTSELAAVPDVHAAEASRPDAEVQQQGAEAPMPAAVDSTHGLHTPLVQTNVQAEQPAAPDHAAQAVLEADKSEVSTSAAARKALQRLRDAAGRLPAEATPAVSADRAQSPPPRPETASRAAADQQPRSVSPTPLPPPAQPSPPPSPPLPQPRPPPAQKQHTMRNVVLAVRRLFPLTAWAC